MPIKNYTTKVPAIQTVGEIQGILAAHGARKVMLDYSEKGTVEAITFGLDYNGMMLSFRLDAHPEGILAIMKKDRCKCDEVQAQNIAWRNIKDWIAAQVALVETNQASMAELFFPNLIGENQMTLFQTFEKGRLMLGEGN